MPDELAKRVHQMQDYGWAGAEFIRRLLSGKDQAHDIWTSLHDKISQSYAEYASSHVDDYGGYSDGGCIVEYVALEHS